MCIRDRYKLTAFKMKTRYGQTYGTDKFKYLREVIEHNVSKNKAIKVQVNKMKITYNLTKDTYNKKSRVNYY